MVRVDLKGIAKVKAKGHTYWYAWRGGPRLRGEPGSPEFIGSYNEAVEQRRTPDRARFRFVVADYKKREFKKLSPSTREEWGKWLDRILDHFGDLRIAQFDRPEKIRPLIRRWRDKWAKTPRTADYGLQVLSRVLAHAVDPLGKISGNPCEGIKHLYSNDRSEIIWTDADVAQIKKTCSIEISHAVDLAGHTGLRLSDLLRLSWSHVDDDAIVLTTGKSRHRREAIIPLYGALRDVLACIPKRSTTILTSSKRRPWTADGFGSSFNKAKIDAKMSGLDLHFNDLRGTAATKFYIAGFTMREIAETLAWEEESVEKIIRRYVGRSAAMKDRIRKLESRK
ncbi:integrase [Bradyrhizobium sp. JR4.1]|uniref:site-specific integrase n=1 Tax=Bradyrhizobium sp. JR4.1 TaxID=3156372 RepID=UPI00339662C1